MQGLALAAKVLFFSNKKMYVDMISDCSCSSMVFSSPETPLPRFKSRKDRPLSICEELISNPSFSFGVLKNTRYLEPPSWLKLERDRQY